MFGCPTPSLNPFNNIIGETRSNQERDRLGCLPLDLSHMAHTNASSTTKDGLDDSGCRLASFLCLRCTVHGTSNPLNPGHHHGRLQIHALGRRPTLGFVHILRADKISRRLAYPSSFRFHTPNTSRCGHEMLHLSRYRQPKSPIQYALERMKI
jgi:hypothetical protein